MNEYLETINYIKKKAFSRIEKLKNYLNSHHLVIIPLAQKMGGKTHYIQFFIEVLGKENFETISAGEIVREIKAKKPGIEKLLEGLGDRSEVLKEILESDSSNLVPDKIMFTILENAVKNIPEKKSIILDGIPRSEHQIAYIKRMEEDTKIPTFFFYFEVDHEILDIRADSRRVCPVCKTDFNLISMPSDKVMMENDEVVMICNNCPDIKLIKKPGDEGKEEIEEARLKYEVLIKKLKNELKDKVMVIKTSVPVKDYIGPKEEVNRAYTFKKTGDTVEAVKDLQRVQTKRGEVYPLSAEFVVCKMLEELEKELRL